MLRKELRDLGRNRVILGAMAALPLIFVGLTIALNLIVARLGAAVPVSAGATSFVPPEQLRAIGSPVQALLVLLNEQLMFFLLLVPVILPTVIASHAIVGEKQARTLEPLLAAPVRTWELLAAKIAAAVLPSVLIGWVAYGLTVAGVLAAAGLEVGRFLWRPLWGVGLPVVGPLLALCSTLISVSISSRVNDVRTAQALAGLTALPLIGGGVTLFVGQTLLGAGFLVGAVAVLVPLDLALLWLATRLFRREAILTRWG